MKTQRYTNILILFAFMAHLPAMMAQDDCSKFYPSQKGKTFTIHQYDKKDKLTAITQYTVKDVSQSGGETVITMGMTLKDGKKKDIISNSEFKATCLGNVTTLDAQSLVAPGLMETYKDMEYSISGDGLSFPNDLTVGEDLPDGEVVMSIDAGIMKMNITVTMIDRKVEAKEQVITPAGSFDCYRLSSTTTTQMGMQQSFTSTQWIAEGIGMVKEETKKSNGKLVSKSVLQQVD